MNWRTGVLVGLALLVAAALLGWQLTPRVESTSPPEGEIRGRQALTVVFSRPMDPASIERSISIDPAYDGEFSWDEAGRVLTFTPRAVWPSGQTVTLTIGRSARSNFRIPLWRDLSLTWPVSPTSLVYMWPADGDSNLYRIDPETGQSQALTALERGVDAYSLAPDRESILFSAPGERGASQILRLDLDSGEASLVLYCSDGLCTNPQLSPDGILLAYEFIPRTAGGLPGVRILDMQDGTTLILGKESQSLESPLWSPSGWLSCYNQTLQGYQFWNPISREELFLPNDTGGDASWSADGRYFLSTRIVFVSDTLAPRHLELFDIVEETTRDLSLGSYLEDLNPSFAPQGLRFAFSRKSLNPQEWSPGRQLWLMDLEGDQAFALTDEPDYQHTSFAWHPGGEALAYVRYNQAALSELPEIWLIQASGENPLRLIINGFAPSWVP